MPTETPQDRMGTCADFPNTPHAKGTCENCDMWTPLEPPVAETPQEWEKLKATAVEISKLDGPENKRFGADILRLLSEITTLRAENERLRNTLREVVLNVDEWCECVAQDASWDSWDHYYKGFKYNGWLDKARIFLPAVPVKEGE